MLRHDHGIAGTVKVFGWLIMIASIVWFLVMGTLQRYKK
jgi:hypothetical protein